MKNKKIRSKRIKKKKQNIIPRLIILAFITVACVQALSSVLAFTSPEFVFAIDDYTFQTQIGDEKSISFEKDTDGNYTTAPIAEYIKIIYKYAIGVVGIVAAVVLMIGGVLWLTAGGNATQVGEAKAWIGSSMIGLVLVLTSYMILSQINTDLINLKTTSIISIPGNETVVQKSTNCQWFVNTAHEKLKPGCPPATMTAWGGDIMKDFKDWKNKAKNDGYCGTNPFKDNPTSCCCKDIEYSFKNWPCQTNICDQKEHASQELKDLIKCLGENLPQDSIVTISSISDSRISSGKKTWEECRKNGCAHSVNSCHYGGKPDKNDNIVDASFAIDLVGDKKAIITAANKCKGDIKYIKDEGSHVHISTPECLSDDKNY